MTSVLRNGVLKISFHKKVAVLSLTVDTCEVKTSHWLVIEPYITKTGKWFRNNFRKCRRRYGKNNTQSKTADAVTEEI